MVKFAAVALLMLASTHSHQAFGTANTTPSGPVPGIPKPNVVLIVTDDQGYGDIGFHGNPIIKTPNLDTLAGESVRLDDYHVAPTCSPTRAALLTGHWQNRTGVWWTVGGRSMLRTDEVTLASMLKDNGYHTAMIGKWHLGDNYPYRPHDRGFEHAYYHGGGGVGQTPDYWNNAYFDGSYFRNGEPERAEGYVTDVFFDEAMSFIDSASNSDKPFFLYLATNAPHGPMHAPQEYADIYKNQNLSVGVQHFLGMITNIDDNIGRLRRFLEDRDLSDNTIFIFTTDNGTSSGNNIFNAGMRGKKGSEYDGGHRVPLFIRWPAGGLSEPVSVDRLTAHVDIVPTVLDLTGTAQPEGVKFDGMSIRPLLDNGETGWPERTLITDSQRVLDPIKWRRAAVMTDRWRLVNGTELYDMDTDPGQQNDIAAQNPVVVEQLREFYENWWAELLPTFSEPTAIVLGSPNANPVRLTSHDWLGTNVQVPWNQRHIRSLEHEADGRHKGYWWVDIQTAGNYEFELRRWPAEAGLPISAKANPEADVPGVKAFRTTAGKPFAAVTAQLEIANQSLEVPVHQSDTVVTLKMSLKAGKAKLIASFSDAMGIQVGAYYVTVTRLPDPLLSSAMQRYYDTWGGKNPADNEFYASFSYAPARGLGYEEGVSRRDPSPVIRVGDHYYVYYTRTEKGPAPVGYEKADAITPANTWDLASIYYATSTDTYNWEEQGIAVGRGPEGEFDERSVFTPGILVWEGKYYLYYQAVSNPFNRRTRNAIGMSWADSPDGPWHRFGEPVLLPGAPGVWKGEKDDRSSIEKEGSFDSLKVHDPYLIVRHGKIYLYYKAHPMGLAGDTPLSYPDFSGGLAIAERPEGPFVKSALNPILNSGHEVVLWPYKSGIAALVTANGPEKNTVQWSPDGENFEIKAHVVLPPDAAGPYVPDAFTNTTDGKGFTWGLSHVSQRRDRPWPNLVRFETNLTKENIKKYKRENIRFGEGALIQADKR